MNFSTSRLAVAQSNDGPESNGEDVACEEVFSLGVGSGFACSNELKAAINTAPRVLVVDFTRPPDPVGLPGYERPSKRSSTSPDAAPPPPTCTIRFRQPLVTVDDARIGGSDTPI